MSFSQSDYRNIPSSGIIPDVMLPADEFSFAYAFFFDRDLDPSEGFNKDITLHVQLKITDSAGITKATLDGQETYHAQVFGFPGLAFYVWEFDNNLEKFSGTDSAGHSLEKDSQASLGSLPASGSGVMNRSVEIDVVFYANIFRLELEPGDRVEIAQRSADNGFVVSQARLKIATRLIGTAIDSTFDPLTGETWTLYNDAKGQILRCASSRRDEDYKLEKPVTVLEKRALYAAISRWGATLYALVDISVNAVTTPRIYLVASYDEGRSWGSVMSAIAEVQALASVGSEDGASIYIYGVATAGVITNDRDRTDADINQHDPVRCVLTRDGVKAWKLGDKTKVKGPKMPIKNVVRLERFGTVFHLYAREDDTLRVLTSRDEMRTWVESG